MLKKVSKKQARKNAKLSKIKSGLDKKCFFCPFTGNDLMHILPKSIFPEYYCEEWNLIIGCREHHNDFDGDRSFRKKQASLFKSVVEKVNIEDKGRVMNYFGML